MNNALIKWSISVCIFLFISSCESGRTESQCSKCFTYDDYLKLQSKSTEPVYNHNKKLEKLNRDWFVGYWLDALPQYSFSDKKSICETDDYEILKKNGDIFYSNDEEPIGKWSYSQNSLVRYYEQYDTSGRKTGKIETIVTHVGKTSENTALLVYDDGKIEAMTRC